MRRHNIFFIEFFITRKCNQKCSYCNIYEPYQNAIEIDLDFIEYIVLEIKKHIKHKDIFIEISGGEPGLVSNLYEVTRIIRKHNIKYYQIMSNGLVRKLCSWYTEIPFYKEHLIYKIKDTNIIKFYDMDLCFESNTKNVIVMTEETTESIIKNYRYFKEVGLINPEKFWYKILVPKTTPDGIKKYYKKLNLFYSSLGYPRYYSKCKPKLSEYQIKLCAERSPHIFIDIQNKKLGHCGLFLVDGETSEITNENIEKFINYKLFDYSRTKRYCKDCYLASSIEEITYYKNISSSGYIYNKDLNTYK